eukprot:gnl/MRDRNA2_/MRDRNA2_96458_c0_seq1.p1 gnl/MRDRNA2_/MRDRNA2_96458_c0~~gnl/MRDRNA2_/MRDRNA2_96458_c0_seq1.p1  ORF type:complete len:539 (-),score=137.93 gnl/MRDRNA2_/MRDRNA2_96458_c0_seq1:101-1717(-)
MRVVFQVVLSIAISLPFCCHAETSELSALGLRPMLALAAEKAVTVKNIDLAAVLMHAVELMDSGVQGFLKEEGHLELEDGEHPLRHLADMQNILRSQRRAMKVMKQVSTNFHDLRMVVNKFKEKHVDKVKDVKSKLAAEEVKTRQDAEEIHDLKAAVQQLSFRSTKCEDMIQQFQAQVTTTTTSQAPSFAVNSIDWEKINKTDTLEIGDLRKQNAELKASVSELTQRVADFTGKSVDEASRASMLENDLGKMRQENKQLKTDKDAVVKTLQQLMSEEQFSGLRRQAQEAQDVSRKVLKEYLVKKQALKKEEEAVNKTLKDKDEDIQMLQQKGQELELEHDTLQASKTRLQTERDTLAEDKQHLLKTVQALMRSNSDFQAQLKRCPASQVQPPKKPVLANPIEDPTAVMGATSMIDGYLANKHAQQAVTRISEVSNEEIKDPPSLSLASKSSSDAGWLGAAEFIASGSEMVADAAPAHSRKHALRNWLSGHKARAPRRLRRRPAPNSLLSVGVHEGSLNAPWKTSLLADVERLEKFTAE